MQYLSYIHICAERLQSGDGPILTFQFRYCGYVHIYAERTWADLPFVEDKDEIGVYGFKADAENWALDPIVAERILLLLRNHIRLNACNDLC